MYVCHTVVTLFCSASVIDRIGFIASVSEPLATNLTALITNLTFKWDAV